MSYTSAAGHDRYLCWLLARRRTIVAREMFAANSHFLTGISRLEHTSFQILPTEAEALNEAQRDKLDHTIWARVKLGRIYRSEQWNSPDTLHCFDDKGRGRYALSNN